jgi:carbohydrate kinase (thermoresistant glucokinase family)
MSPITCTGTPSQIVVMGVTGCGKTTIGKLLGKALGLEFKDGDALHPQANKDKMSAGIPLTDEDRWPWLDQVGQTLKMTGGVVVACSALKRKYRERILSAAPKAVFVQLQGDKELLRNRLNNRTNHFMPTSLLDSQLQTLEPLEMDETGVVVDVGGSESEILKMVLTQLQIDHSI